MLNHRGSSTEDRQACPVHSPDLLIPSDGATHTARRGFLLPSTSCLTYFDLPPSQHPDPSGG